MTGTLTSSDLCSAAPAALATIRITVRITLPAPVRPAPASGGHRAAWPARPPERLCPRETCGSASSSAGRPPHTPAGASPSPAQPTPTLATTPGQSEEILTPETELHITGTVNCLTLGRTS